MFQIIFTELLLPFIINSILYRCVCVCCWQDWKKKCVRPTTEILYSPRGQRKVSIRCRIIRIRSFLSWMDVFSMLMSAYLTDTIYKFDKCKGTKKEYPQNQRPAMWKNNNNAIQRVENQRYELQSSKPEKKNTFEQPTTNNNTNFKQSQIILHKRNCWQIMI